MHKSGIFFTRKGGVKYSIYLYNWVKAHINHEWLAALRFFFPQRKKIRSLLFYHLKLFFYGCCWIEVAKAQSTSIYLQIRCKYCWVGWTYFLLKVDFRMEKRDIKSKEKSKYFILANSHTCLDCSRHKTQLLNFMSFLVSYKVRGSPKPFTTAGAFEGFLSWMRSTVTLKVCITCEPLSTVSAREGLVPTVDALMALEMGTTGEAFATTRAAERTFSSVSSLVASDMSAAGESFTADTTFIGALSSVSAVVAGQVGIAPKGFAAVGALVGSLPRMGFLMPGQVGTAGKSLPTVAAAEGTVFLWHLLSQAFPT